ncbi:hypothetical protein ACIP98_29210 [Streptomyces sp. NPDC088354]|uniref:hypothetical protein n=1 Tax=Streptomyces sp. NPDC088354 TaxID=3365856 RepID=UPI003805D0B2
MFTDLPDILALTGAVAAALGPEWSTEPYRPWNDPHAYLLRHSDGRTIRFHVSTLRRDYGRLHAQGMTPESFAPGDARPYMARIDFGHITMAGTKAAPQVAAEIARRLLPTVTAAYTAWHNAVRRAQDEDARRREVAEQLAAIPGMTRPSRRFGSGDYDHDPRWFLRWDATPRSASGYIQDEAGATVAVDIDAAGGKVSIQAFGLFPDQAHRALHELVHPQSAPSLRELCDRIEDAAQEGFPLSTEDRAAIAHARNPRTDDGQDDTFGTVPLRQVLRNLAARAACHRYGPQ